MQGFNVRFDSPLVSADMANESCFVHVAKTETPAPILQKVEEPAVLPPEPEVTPTTQTVDAIKNAMQEAVSELSSQRKFMESTAASFAVEIARVFLGSINEIVEQRLQQNVIRVLQHPDSVIVKLHVHSSCYDFIKQWLDEESDLHIPDLGVEVFKSDDLAPGDCRVDFGQSGRLASFEDQLKLVESRLRESIRTQPTGGHG